MHEAAHRFDAEVKFWLFPQVLESAGAGCVSHLQGQYVPAIAASPGVRARRGGWIYGSIVAGAAGAVLKPLLRTGSPEGSTRYVGFDTAKTVFATRADKCHISHVAEDSGWESKLAQTLESMDEVHGYVKNQGLQFTIPYSLNGDEKQYFPDFIVRIGKPEVGGRRPEDLLNLIVEVTGEGRKDKAAKVAAAEPGIGRQQHGRFGRWAFVEVTDPWDALPTIRAAVSGDFRATDGHRVVRLGNWGARRRHASRHCPASSARRAKDPVRRRGLFRRLAAQPGAQREVDDAHQARRRRG